MLEQIPGGGAQVRFLRGQHTGHLFNVLRGLFDKDVHGVVEGHDTDHSLVRVHHGQRKEVVLGQHLRHFLLVGQGGDGDDVFIHDLADGGVVVDGQQQILDGDRAENFPFFGDVAGVDGLLVHTGSADAGDGLRDGHAGPQGDVLRGHDGAGGVFRIAQDLVDLLAHLGIGLGENTLDHAGGHFLHQIRRVVDVQLADDLAQLLIGDAADQRLLQLGAELGKSLGRQFLGQQAEEQRDAVLIQVFKERGDVRAVHGDKNVFQGLVLLFLQKYPQCFFYRDTVFCHLVFLLYEVCSGWEADTQAKVLFR